MFLLKMALFLIHEQQQCGEIYKELFVTKSGIYKSHHQPMEGSTQVRNTIFTAYVTYNNW